MRTHAIVVAMFTLGCGSGSIGGAGGSGGGVTSSSTSASTAASSGAGGASSSASTGGAGGGGGAADPCAGRLVCDDFEDDTLGAAPLAPWQSATNAGAVVVDDAHAHSGAHAIKVSTEAGQYKQALFYVQGAPAFPIAGDVVYGRMMFYTEQPTTDGVHWTMAVGSGPLPGHDGVTAFYRYGGMNQGHMMANYETSGLATDCWDNSQTPLPIGQWSCMEWRFDGVANELRFWLDGQEIADLHVVQQGMGCIGHDLQDQWLGPTFDRMAFGWESYQTDGARDAWIDDVVVDAAPIGCPP